MSTTLRFPFNRNRANIARNEISQIITILPLTVGNLRVGGAQTYADVRAWETAGERNTEAPYPCVVVEFSGSVAGIIGNGTTDLIGLYGQIDSVDAPTTAAQRKRTLLAILGLNIGNQMPQIPLVQQAAAASDFVGFSQAISNVAAYDRLSIGGVLADVALPENMLITVVARPIRQRDYLG